MTRLALLVLALGVGAAGCASEAGSAAHSANVSFYVSANIVTVRGCDYVVACGITPDAGVGIVHAADCQNPAHQVSR